MLYSESRNKGATFVLQTIIWPSPVLSLGKNALPSSPEVNRLLTFRYLCHTRFTWLWFHLLILFLDSSSLCKVIKLLFCCNPEPHQQVWLPACVFNPKLKQWNKLFSSLVSIHYMPLCLYTKHIHFISCQEQIEGGGCIFAMWKGKNSSFLVWLFLLQKARWYFMGCKYL